jgi:16S rRNA processing protein RimM
VSGVERNQTGWVALAVLGPTHANRGEITGVPLTHNLERFQKLHEVWLFDEAEEPHHMEIETVWEHSNRLVFKFRGIDSISDAERWRGAEVRIPVADREPLEEGAFYFSDLIGCEVWDRKLGDRVGCVVAVREFGGPGVLELDNGLLIPYAKAICVNIDPPARRIDVDLPDGLRELNRP